MSKIRSSNTQFERQFVSELITKTRREFRLNDGSLKGKPDIVFCKEKTCVFLDSDFWHGWQYPRWKNILNDFWKMKIENTRARDRRATAYLRSRGWKVVRIWGHDMKQDFNSTIMTVIKALKK